MSVKAELESDGSIWLETQWVHRDLVRTVPGTRWDRAREQWHVPASWSACLALRSTFRDSLEIGPVLAQWAWKRKAEVDRLMELRTLTDFSGAADMYGWQRSGAEFISVGRRVGIFDDPGAGKTCTAIRGLAKLHGAGVPVFPALVVCPNSMKMTWAREFEHWWPGVECSVVKGSAVARRKALKEPAHVYIINTEALRSHSRLAPFGSIGLKRCLDHGGEDPKVTETTCEVHLRELNKVEFNAVIADEAHRFKAPSSKQTRALWAATGDAEVRVALTGTPIANDVTDLWPILHWLEPEEWGSKTRWIDRYVDTMLNAFNALMVIGVKAAMHDEFYASINPRFRRMPEEVVLSHLPPIVNERRDCEMSAKQKKAYKQMKDEMVAELEDDLLLAPSPMIAKMRLGQLASSFGEIVVVQVPVRDPHTNEIVRDPVTGEVKTLPKQRMLLAEPSSKVDALMADMPDYQGRQVAVMAVSRQLIELLSRRLEKAKVPHGLVTGAQDEDERQRAIDEFQAGKLPFLLFTAAAGGSGITLTAARYLVRLQRPWSLVDDKQALRRVRRIGSERHESIIVVDYITEGTVEYDVLEALDKKGVSFEEVVKDRDAFLAMLKRDEAA